MSNINKSKNWKAPASWDKTFSKAILEVADEMNVDVTANHNSRKNCLFIRITPRTYYKTIITLNDDITIDEYYLKQAFDNLNINGLDYQEDEEIEEIILKTCVGVRNYWFNEWLYPMLYDKNKNNLTKYGLMIEEFCKTFDGVFFERMVRYAVAHYRYCEIYYSLKDYLAYVFSVGIWDGYELEYLQIGTPKLSLTRILRGDIAEIEKLKKQIEFHIKLMLLIDWILHK